MAYDNGAYVQACTPPGYTPAVVGFFGIRLVARIIIEALSHGSIGWVPLAPGLVVKRPGEDEHDDEQGHPDNRLTQANPGWPPRLPLNKLPVR